MQEALKKRQDQIKRQSMSLAATSLQFRSRELQQETQTEDKKPLLLSPLGVKPKLKDVRMSPMRQSGSAENLTLMRTARGKKFALDYATVQTIKNNFRSFNPKTVRGERLERLLTNKPRSTNTNPEKSPLSGKKGLAELVTKYKRNPYLRQILSKYRLSFEKLEQIIKQFAYLIKVTTFMKTHKPPEIDVTKSSGKWEPQKGEQMIARLLDMTTIGSAEADDIVKYEDYRNLRVNLAVVKVYFKKLRCMPLAVFNRLLLALDVNPSTTEDITLNTFAKMRYYLIDLHASVVEYISFGANFIEPSKGKGTTIDDVMRLLKLLLIRDDEDNAKRELLIKALVSNFVLCEVIDGAGRFRPDVFEDVYRRNRMSIMSFIKILLS